jgi:hypothetical protein
MNINPLETNTASNPRPRRRLLSTLLVSACALAGILPAHAQSDYITTVENTPNLLGYWRFTPTSQANSEVNGYTGTFKGNAMLGSSGSGPTLAIDPANRPVALDGTTGTYVDTSLTGQIDQQGSIVGWFNLSALPSTVGHILSIAGESQVGNDFDLQIETDNKIKFYTSGSGATVDPAALTAADLGSWIFVAATFTANNDRNIYVNGVLVASDGPGFGGHSLGNGTFAMGESDVFTGRQFQGGLDEVAVYNRDLTAAEIANIYASRTVVVPEPFTWTLMLGGVALLVIGHRLRRSNRLIKQ